MEDRHNKNIGALGERVAEEHLRRGGFEILERNYLRKWGEIDIIAEKNGVIHFIEVKTAIQNNSDDGKKVYDGEQYRAEENVHPRKLERLSRAVSSYLAEHKLNESCEWKFDVIVVNLTEDLSSGTIKILSDLTLEE